MPVADAERAEKRSRMRAAPDAWHQEHQNQNQKFQAVFPMDRHESD
jgi:hypothetical protein